MTSVLSGDARPDSGRSPLPPSMIERVTLIMDLFENPRTRRTLEQIARSTRLPRSTTYRIIEQLVRLQWLDRGPNGYRLGPRALGLGGREFEHSALRAAAAPVLHELAVRTGLVIHLAVLDGAEVYYLDKMGGPAAVEVPSRVGGRAPAHCTALGKAMLAWLPPEDVDALYRDGLPRRTPRSIGDVGVLHRQLVHIRSVSGLTFERGECVPHIGCAGVALRTPDGPVGALSAVCDVRTPMRRLAPVLAAAARAVLRELSDGPAATRCGQTPFCSDTDVVAEEHGGAHR
ncbi:IclR family transcriptional regulator [Nocardia sp. NPDC020380]|uniref:IclR family transcriptional regulator n=1 Tax=Nocardia sp. NPDC020380 TaxID=3364309 RepID=UPI0037ADA827